MVDVSKIYFSDLFEDKITVKELIYILKQLDKKRTVRAYFKKDGEELSLSGNVVLVSQDVGEDSICLFVDAESEVSDVFRKND